MAPSEFGPARSQSSQTGTPCCSTPSQITPRNCTVHRKLCTHCKYFNHFVELLQVYTYRFTKRDLTKMKEKNLKHRERLCIQSMIILIISFLFMRYTILEVVIHLTWICIPEWCIISECSVFSWIAINISPLSNIHVTPAHTINIGVLLFVELNNLKN